jgi:hypothetical protein
MCRCCHLRWHPVYGTAICLMAPSISFVRPSPYWACSPPCCCRCY